MKIFVVRHRTFFARAVCAVIGVGVMILAQHTGKAQVKSTQLSQRDIIEKLDGKDASATVRMVTIGPGQKDMAHRHTGPVFGYVLEGEYEHAMGEEPVKSTRPGKRSTNHRALCTGWPATRAPKPRLDFWR